ncbi:MAG: hypothetical protein PHI85_01715 [Victivallaceae bacterium]|nr:hypothetical protein [Victivallaceae bacterium]
MNNIDNAVETATERLKDDYALHAEVAAELRDHLEESACDSGSEEEALKRFGEPEEIAGQLFTANLSRFKWHSLARMIMKYAALPAMAAGLYFSVDPDLLRTARNFLPLMNGRPQTAPMPDDPESQFLIAGDRSRKGKAQQLRAIWEKYPDNKMYMATYIDQLLLPIDDNAAIGKETVEKELELAMAVDPDNAIFNYYLAFIDPGVTGDGHRQLFVVTDRGKLDRTMQTLSAGYAKPYLTSFSKERGLQLVELYNCEAREKLSQSMLYTLTMADCPLPHPSMFRRAANINLLYAEMLIDEGKSAEALPYLEAWKPMLTQLNRKAWTLIDNLVMMTVARKYSQQAALLYRKAGMEDKAAALETELAPLIALHDAWRVKDANYGATIKEHGGMMANLLLPNLRAVTPLTPEMLRPECQLDYLLVDIFALTICAAGMLLICAVTALRLFFCVLIVQRPRFVVLPLKNLLQIFALGIALPLAIFFVTSWLDPLNWRELGIKNEISVRFMAFNIVWLGFVTPFWLMGLYTCTTSRYVVKLTGKKPDTATTDLNLLMALMFATLLIAAICQPMLQYRKNRIFAEDSVFFKTPLGFSTIEEEIINAQRQVITDCLEKTSSAQ